MNIAPHHDAINRRLEMLAELWSNFSSESKTFLGRWLVQDDELRMMDVFFEFEKTEHGYTDDLFIGFDRPFEDNQQYLKAIAQQFVELIEQDKVLLEESNAQLNWSAIDEYLQLQHPHQFVQLLSFFYASLNDFPGKVIAYLSPQSISDKNDWLSFLEYLIQCNFTDAVKIMIVDRKSNELYGILQEKYPALVYSIEPKLDMAVTIRQSAASGDPNEPGVQFRKLFIDISQAGQHKQLEKMELLGQKAIGISQQHNWPALQIAVYNLMATSFSQSKNWEKTMEHYSKAYQVAQSAYQQEVEQADQLLIQTNFYIAAAYFTQQQYENAIRHYQENIPVAKANKHVFYEMESHRMIGTCQEQLKQWTPAVAAYQAALAVAEQLDEPVRTQSTVHITGQAIKRIYQKKGLDNEIPDLRKKMFALLGHHDWENEKAHASI